jgi:hypothetical protein
MPPTRSLTEADRDARRAKQRELMAAAVEQLRCSEGWRGYLRARTVLRGDYSAANVILIASQRPTATRVAGFAAWRELGYSVCKRPQDVPEGRWAIRIWARCEPSRKRLEAWRARGAVAADRPKAFYKLVNIFAQDQVQPLPPPVTPAPLDPPPVPQITGDSHARLLQRLTRLAGEIGYRIELGDTGAADGVCRRRQRAIVLAERLSLNAQLATGIHEVAHALIGEDKPAPELSYAEEELVVESVAYLACRSVGLPTDENSIPYLASWAQEASLEVLQRAAELCDRLARRIEDALADPDPASGSDHAAVA